MPIGEVFADAAEVVLPAGAADPVGAGRDHVRARDADRGGGGRRVRRDAAGRRLPRADLGAAARSRCILTARTSAMVCWLFVGSATFAVGLRLPRRQTADQGVRARPEPDAVTFLLLAQVIIFLLGWPLEWTEIIIIFVPIFLPLLRALRHRPDPLRHPGGAEPADRVPVAADGDVGLLPEGRGAASTCC